MSAVSSTFRAHFGEHSEKSAIAEKDMAFVSRGNRGRGSGTL